MKLTQLVKVLEKHGDISASIHLENKKGVEVYFSCDEEGNVIYKKADISTDEEGNIIIYPLSGSEIGL